MVTMDTMVFMVTMDTMDCVDSHGFGYLVYPVLFGVNHVFTYTELITTSSSLACSSQTHHTIRPRAIIAIIITDSINLYIHNCNCPNFCADFLVQDVLEAHCYIVDIR